MVRFADEVQPAQEDPEHSEHPDHAENKVLSRLRHEGAKRTPSISDEQCPSDGEGGRKGEGPSQSRSQSEAEDVPNELRSAKSKKKAHRQVHRQATWLRIDKFGNTSLVSTDKWRTALKLGVRARDLRLLEPGLASLSPPAILDRERAIVVQLGDAAKCIITLEYVLVVNPEEEAAQGLIAELKDKLPNPLHVGKVMSYPGLSRISDIRRTQVAQQTGGAHAPVGLSFELKVLEVCLDTVVQRLDGEAREVEGVVIPALEKLTRRIQAPDLELVRRSKNRLTRLTTRVESTKEVLEKFLQDDDDMHKLNLTAMEFSRAATLQGDLRDVLHRGTPGSRSRGRSKHVSRGGSPGGSSSSSSSSDSSLSSTGEAEVAEVAMLLEAYQMHLDTTYNRLVTLEQYVQDTEDLVNTGLDTNRNAIIAADIVLTSVMTMLGLSTALSGMFAVNLDQYSTPMAESHSVFLWVVVLGCTGGPLLLLVAFLVWAKRQGFLSV